MNQYSKAWLPESVLNSRGVPIEHAGAAKEVAERVRQGRALLKIVETPWGIEFYIVDVEGMA